MTNDFMPAFGEVKVDQFTESRISTVISMLPTSLQSRIPPIRFLRRSISLHSLRSGVLVSDTSRKPRPFSDSTLGQEPLVTEMIEQNEGRRYSKSTPGSPRPIRRVLYSEPADDEHPAVAASGVLWKFARQGASLVNISIDGGKPAVAEEDIAFERKAYVDGVTYLLKGLPSGLDASEIERIQSALPDEFASHSDPVAMRREAGSARTAAAQPRSLLHRAVQITVVNSIILLSFLMPYVMYLLRYAARTERKYKISENLVGQGMDFVNAIGKQGIQLTESIGQMNDGKVGQTFLEALTWTADGVTRGISDGVGEGLAIVGSRSITSMSA
ncbi:Fc.00g089520.m01.CDS01 [Cosmosporella sp. VM-42]